jgi:hypothetical protein
VTHETTTQTFHWYVAQTPYSVAQRPPENDKNTIIQLKATRTHDLDHSTA